jgi:site-specific recombinase XerD
MSITRDIDTARTGTRQARVMKDSRTTAAARASDVIQWFLDYYWIRHPISEGAMVAYRADLVALEEWLLAFRNSSLQSAGAKDLRAFLESQYRDGRSAGHMPSVSCIKRFYFYLVEVGLRTDDPTERVFVRMPRREKQDLKVVVRESI